MAIRALTIVLTFFSSYVSNAQVTNSSYQAKTGEKVLQLSIIVPIERKAAWELFTKDEQLMRWIAPLAHMDLKTGGTLVTNYNKSKSLADSSSIKLGVVNFLENELLTLKVNLNNNFSRKVQEEDDNLQEILQFVDMGNGKTKIISSMVGWGQGDDWNKVYDFFTRGNEWTYQEMLKLF